MNAIEHLTGMISNGRATQALKIAERMFAAAELSNTEITTVRRLAAQESRWTARTSGGMR